MRTMSVYGPWISSYPQWSNFCWTEIVQVGDVFYNPSPAHKAVLARRVQRVARRLSRTGSAALFLYSWERYILAVEEADQYSYLIVPMWLLCTGSGLSEWLKDDSEFDLDLAEKISTNKCSYWTLLRKFLWRISFVETLEEIYVDCFLKNLYLEKLLIALWEVHSFICTEYIPTTKN